MDKGMSAQCPQWTEKLDLSSVGSEQIFKKAGDVTARERIYRDLFCVCLIHHLILRCFWSWILQVSTCARGVQQSKRPPIWTTEDNFNCLIVFRMAVQSSLGVSLSLMQVGPKWSKYEQKSVFDTVSQMWLWLSVHNMHYNALITCHFLGTHFFLQIWSAYENKITHTLLVK